MCEPVSLSTECGGVRSGAALLLVERSRARIMRRNTAGEVLSKLPPLRNDRGTACAAETPPMGTAADALPGPALRSMPALFARSGVPRPPPPMKLPPPSVDMLPLCEPASG